MSRVGSARVWKSVPPLRSLARRLPTGSFAFVMATGIVSSAFDDVGWAAASLVLLIFAAASAVVLFVLTVVRFVLFRGDVMNDARDPKKAFGFFTIVAAVNVIGYELYSSQNPVATIALALLSAVFWLMFTYGLPANLMLPTRPRPVASDIDGSWFLWVVGTQSLAIVVATVGADIRSPALADLSVGLWGIGVLLYLMLATLVTLRLLTVPSTPGDVNPSYWIYMGATAITVLAGSRILLMPADLPIMTVTTSVVSGLTYVLWAFGVWWVPLLLIFGIWRHVIHRDPLGYSASLWSIVFPLGMYSVASTHFGQVAHLPLLVTIGEVGSWVAGLAWLAVFVGMVYAGAGSARRRVQREAVG